MIKRIIDKQTNLFIRDDFTFDETMEIGLDVIPAQGLYKPMWNGKEWVEGATQDYIDSLKLQFIAEPSLEDIAAEHDTKIITLEEELDVIFGD